jgi:hypothetical protein
LLPCITIYAACTFGVTASGYPGRVRLRLQCCSVCETRSAGRMQTSTILNTRAAVSFFNPPRDIIKGLWGEARGTDVLLSERIGGGKTCVQPRFCSHSTASRINEKCIQSPSTFIHPSIHPDCAHLHAPSPSWQWLFRVCRF